MKLPIYPIVIAVAIATVGGVALWRAGAPVEYTREEAPAILSQDGDGDFDGDPVPLSEDEDEEEDEVPAEPVAETPSTPAPTPTPTPTPSTPQPSGYTLAQVSAHATAQSCWSAIGGNVYDLTSWINAHPGGKSAILRLCGTDGTAAFDAQHGGASRPERELATFKIGALI